MNYAAIKKHDIANGPGVRVSLFVSGCTHHCEGCFNPETWDFQYGTPYTAETELEILTGDLPKNATVVSVVTGNGLKDVANAIKACGEPISIPSDMDLLLRAFDEHGINADVK